jgi:probable HAF family extracellular repeat protein
VLVETQCRTALTMCVRAAAVVSVLTVAAPAHAQGPPYSFQALNYPAAKSTRPYGINNSGVIVGTFVDQTDVSHGFKYDQGTYTTIDFPGSTHNHVLGLNHQGQILGSHSFDGVNGPWHSFVYENGAYTQFDFPGFESDARGINTAGDIVGVYNSGGLLPTQGFTRAGTDTYATFNYPGALYTFLWGINDAGTISGSYIAQNDPLYLDRGFVYSKGVFTRIDYPGAFETTVIGVNNLEDVVGSYVQGSAVYSFVFSTGRFRSFAVPTATNTRAMAINDSRHVAGFYFSVDCPGGCGFLAQPAAGLPRCDQSLALSHSGSTLNFTFTLATATPMTWETWLFAPAGTFRLWSLPLGVTPNTTPFTVPVPLRPSGKLVGLSGLSVPGIGMICADYRAIDTGTQ